MNHNDIDADDRTPRRAADLPIPAAEADRNAPASEGMLLHREELRAGTERVVTERVRLRRRIVTEQRTITVEVRKEILEVVNEPAAPGELFTDADQQGTGDLEIILHAEEPQVSLQVVPVERVRVVRTVHTEQVPVSAEVGREEVKVEHMSADGRPVEGLPQR